MKTISASYELETEDIQVLSNLTSITAKAHRISRLDAVKSKENTDPATIHLNFEVKPHSEHLPSFLGETEELDLVLSLDDAVEIGLILVAMGLENKSRLEVEEVFRRLFELACQLHT